MHETTEIGIIKCACGNHFKIFVGSSCKECAGKRKVNKNA